MGADNMAITMEDIIREKGFVKGYSETIAGSLAKGIEPMFAHGVKVGIEQGKILAKQEDIIRVLYSRCPDTAFAVKSKIQSIHDITCLNTIFNNALTAETIDEFSLQIDDS